MKTILIIYSQAEFTEVLSRVLGKRGVRVIGATTGQEGLRQCQEHNPDCIFIDSYLNQEEGGPYTGGIEVLKKLKEIGVNANIYIMVGSEEVLFLEKEKLFGATGYLLKPIEIEEIIKIVEGL